MLIPNPWATHAQVGLLEHSVAILLVLWGIVVLFSMMVVPIYSPADSAYWLIILGILLVIAN